MQEKKKSRPSEIERDLLSKALPRKLTAVQCEDLASEVRERIHNSVIWIF